MALKNKISSFFSTYIHTSIQPLSLRAIPTSRESNLSRLNHTITHSPIHTLIQPYIYSLLIIFLLSQTFVFAEVRYVSKTGSSTPPYTSWETASDSIQKAINISKFGDTIYVANGEYVEQIIMKNGISLIGSGVDSCIINTISLATTTSFNSVFMKDSCLIEGFHIMVANTTLRGNGISCYPGSNDPLYFYGEIRNNKISLGMNGIKTSNAFLTIRNNIFENLDRGIDVGALDNSVICTVYNNYLYNIRSYGIVTSLSCRAVIYNNIVSMNSAINRGIGIFSAGASEIYNNLLLSNQIGTANYGINSNPYFNKIRNNIVVSFVRGIQVSENDTPVNNIVLENKYGFYQWSSGHVVRYNNSWNNQVNYQGFTPDSTNMSVDPMFENDDSLNFYLQMYSLLIDAGDPEILDVDGSRSDLGIYGGPLGQRYNYLDLPPRIPVNISAVVDSETVTIKWNKNTESDFNHYRLFRDTVSGFKIDSTNLVTELKDSFYTHKIKYGVSGYYYKLTAVDNQGNESVSSEELAVILTSINEYPLIVNDYILYQNYPNPFNPTTKISYRLKEAGYVKLYVYDIKGELINILVNENQNAGYYEVEFNASLAEGGLSSGMYVYRIQVIESERNIPVFTDTKKMLLIK